MLPEPAIRTNVRPNVAKKKVENTQEKNEENLQSVNAGKSAKIAHMLFGRGSQGSKTF